MYADFRIFCDTARDLASMRLRAQLSDPQSGNPAEEFARLSSFPAGPWGCELRAVDRARNRHGTAPHLSHGFRVYTV